MILSNNNNNNRPDQEFLNSVPNLKLIHHQILRHYVNVGDIILKPVNISDDIKILTVEDTYNCSKQTFLHTNIPSSSLEKICVEKYIKWISKVIGLRDYISTHYDFLPEFILYLDSFDTIVVNDIDSPKTLLEYYNCKILFNKEGGFGHDGCLEPSQEYYNIWLGEVHEINSKLINKLYGISQNIGLNAGMFIGYKKYLLEILEEMVDYHEKDFNMGFPYGSIDDQNLFRYMFLKYPDIIGLDVFCKLFTQAARPEFPPSDPNYFNYFCKYETNYIGNL